VRNLRQRSLRVGERNADTLWPVCLCRVQSQSVECQRSGIPTVPPTYTWAFIYSTYTDYSCASTAINEHDFTGLCFFDSNNTGHYSYIFICQSASAPASNPLQLTNRPAVKYFGTQDCTGNSYLSSAFLGERTWQTNTGYSNCWTDVGAPSANRPPSV
jgi:hypothetical protein